MPEHGGHGRQHFQVLLIDERELVLVHRVVAEPDTERVEHAVLRLVDLLGGLDFERHQLFVDDRSSVTPGPRKTLRSIVRAA